MILILLKSNRKYSKHNVEMIPEKTPIKKAPNKPIGKSAIEPIAIPPANVEFLTCNLKRKNGSGNKLARLLSNLTYHIYFTVVDQRRC